MTHLEIIGRVWSDWIIHEKLGEGSFGQVFKAEKERYGIIQNSAIKVVRIPSDDAELKRVQSGFGLDEQELRDYFCPQIEKLKKEIVLTQELGEDNHIVKILDFEIIDSPSDNICWYILIRMEFLECLENYIKRADITVADVVAVGEDVLTSLEVCEERNIIHRDIKPANLFRSDKGVYKLGDFGIARDMRAGMGSLSHKGTENYMAPEVYLGKKYTSNIDIYALGIVLYKLLNKNRLPFMNEEKLTAGSVERAFQKRNTGEELPKPVESPDTLYEIIKKMCAYNPDERFQTAFEVKKALSEYRQNHKEELKRLLNVARKAESIQRQVKEQPVNEIVFEQVKNDSKVNDNESNISSIQSDKKYSGTKDIKDIEPEPSNSNNNENKTEDYKDGGTKSIYEASRQSQANVAVQPVKEQVSKEKTVIERVEQAPKKRSKIGLILGIGVGVLVLLIGTFIFIGSNVKEDDYVIVETSETTKKKNKETEAETREETRYKEETAASEEESSAEKDTVKEGGEAIAREIADDDSIFEIDTDKYAEYSMEYTTRIKLYSKLEKEVVGIYIGKIESGKPNGYGVF
ncbi:MAG: serine/threonine-protein kinase, partial [Prevotella melaninogenica]